jgi:hypothetical protein
MTPYSMYDPILDGFTLACDAEDRVKAIDYNGTQKRVEYDYDGRWRRARILLCFSKCSGRECGSV